MLLDSFSPITKQQHNALKALTLEKLEQVSAPHAELVTNVRGRGLMCAFDLPDHARSLEVVRRCLEEKLIVFPCGTRSVRLRPTLTIGEEEVDRAIEVFATVFRSIE